MSQAAMPVLIDAVIGAGFLVFVFSWLVLWRVRARQKLLSRMRKLEQQGSGTTEAVELQDGGAPSIAVDELRMRVVSLERRVGDLRRDFDLGSRLQRKAAERPLVASFLAMFGAIVVAGLGGVLSALLQRLLLPPVS